MKRQLAHETLGFQKHSLAAEIYHEFSPGDQVMTVDGLPGKVTAVLDGPYPSTEVYEVRLDGGAGGGKYSSGQLSRMSTTSPTAMLSGDTPIDFGPVEGTTTHQATEDYPELGEILAERPPNERVRVYAALTTSPDPADDRSVNNLEAGKDAEEVRRTKQEEADSRALPAVEDIDPPSACSFCGSTDFEEPSNTGRGTRMRCAQCGGTMTSWGGQWQPEMPNSPENAASRQGDYRSTINDLSAVHAAATHPHGEELIRNAETMYGADRSTWSNAALRAAVKHGDEHSQNELKRRTGRLDPETLWHFTATWADVRRKAKRIKDEGGVRIVAATREGITGEVQGEHGIYESAFTYMPGRKVIAAWDCGCKWGAYAWGRAPAYARFEGRQCSHVTALQYEAQSRGMFGHEVYHDEDRLEGQQQRTPVTVQYQRPTERDEGGNRNRRTVPPGNMFKKFPHPSLASLSDDLPPIAIFALQMIAAEDDEDAILRMLAGYGVNPARGLSVLAWAVDAADKNKNGIDDTQEATADPMGGQAAPGTDIPRLGDRDQTDAKHKKKHILHHTNDSRQHAPNFGYGIGHGMGPMIWCDQCNGSGCGHCGGTGQVVAPGGSPVGGPGVGDLSMTTSPVADQGMDAGDAVSGDSGGLSSTGSVGPGKPHSCPCCQGKGEHSCGHECYACDASGSTAESHGELCDPQNHHDDVDGSWTDDVAPERRGDIGMAPTAGLQLHEMLRAVYADYSSGGDMMTGDPAQNYQAPTPHSNSPNPGSTGWGSSADPPNWEQPLVGQDMGTSWHSAAKEPEFDGPTVSGVALKAADTGRVLMIQRSHKDEKDPARGTWEFPGGHHEDGDQTSLHAGIREWQEEVGQPFPQGGHVSHTWRSGPYQGHVVVVPKEQEAVDFSNGRATTNPDDPDGDDHEQSAWWEIEHAKKNPALRPELKSAAPWKGIEKAAALSAPCETPGAQYSTSVSGDTAEVSVKLPFDIPVGTAADADHLESHMHNAMEEILAPYFVNPPKAGAYLTMDEARAAAHEEEQRTGKTSEQLLREHVAWQESQFPGFGQHVMNEYDRTRAMATLHDKPEPALPSTDGAEDDGTPDAAGLLADAPGQYLSTQPETPWGYGPGDPNLGGDAQPAPPQAPPEGDADHDMLADDTSNNLPFRPEGALERAQTAAEIVAAFQATAAGQALKESAPTVSERSGGFKGSSGGEFSDGDIAANMRRVLDGDLSAIDKTASKDFSFSEQQELISEGGHGGRARNFDDLDIEGTHYARLGEDEVADDEFLLLL